METLQEIFNSHGLVALSSALVAGFVLFIFKNIVWRILRRAVAKTAITWDDELLERLNAPVRFLIVYGAFLIGLNFYPEFMAKHSAVRGFQKIGFILIGTWMINRSVVVFLRAILSKHGVKVGTQQFISAITQVAIFFLGILAALDTLGVSITPILASLGVGSLAVALALQDTLGNLFAGFYLYFDQPVRVGDFVRLEDGSEGYIQRIGWRSTLIHRPSDSVVVIPNTKICNSIITNYDMPSSDVGINLSLGVSYNSDLNHVEKVTIEVAQKVMQTVPGGVPNFIPALRYKNFGESSIDFDLALRVKHWTDQGLIKHEVIKAIHTKYNQEKIDIPFPQRVIHHAPSAPLGR
jgi:small-conductance mechanosensitive channel